MDYQTLIPLINDQDHSFENCKTLQDFFMRIVELIPVTSDSRRKQSYLAVFMAFRDHYPSYLQIFDDQKIEEINKLLEIEKSKIIKLRRIAISRISKVA